MPIKPFDSSETIETEFTSMGATKASEGTVLKAFNGPTRRFAVGYVVIDTDLPDLPMSLDDLRAAGFVA